METELIYAGFEEWYRTLRMYGFPIPPEEADIVDNIAARWDALCAKAKKTDRSLGRVKKQFTIVTQGQVKEFQAQVQELYDEFIAKGPGTGCELDAGLEMMTSYNKKLGEFNAIREELGEALKLFGLPIVAYPQLAEINHSLEELTSIYSIFGDYLEARENWAATLWSELELSTKSINHTSSLTAKLEAVVNLGVELVVNRGGTSACASL